MHTNTIKFLKKKKSRQIAPGDLALLMMNSRKRDFIKGKESVLGESLTETDKKAREC